MLYWLLSAWIMGFIGSAHCIGMCGPLALALPVQTMSVSNRFYSSLVYNLGRVLSYAFYGSLIGIAQKILVPFAFQSVLSIVIGSVLLLLSVYFLFFKTRVQFSTNNKWYQWVVQKIGSMYARASISNIFFIGVLNGFLPCGLVYAAMATAFASSSVVQSTLFMAFFGLGTLPAMWSIVFFAEYISPSIRQSFRKVYPFIYALTGIMLILRGIADYNTISPFMNQEGVICN